MAGNPFDEFDSPTGNAFDEFDEKPKKKPDDAKKADQTVKPTGYDDATGAGLAADTAYRAANTGTMGGLDYLTAGVNSLTSGGNYSDNLAKVRQQNDEWGANHPYLGMGADVAGYALGPGKLKIGARLAELGGAKLAARMAGSAVEGGVTTGVSALGHGADVDTAIHEGVGGTMAGALTGALPGNRPRPNTPSVDSLGQTAKQAYANIPGSFAPQDIADALDQTAIKPGLKFKQSPSLTNQIAKVQGDIATTGALGRGLDGSDIANLQTSLRNAAKTPEDYLIAEQYIAQLNKTVGPKTASAINDASQAHSAFKTTGEIADLTDDPLAAPGQVKKMLKNQGFLYQGKIGDSLAAIAKMAPSKAELTPAQAASKAVVNHLLGAAGGYATGELLGGGLFGDTAGAALGAYVPSLFTRNKGKSIGRSLLAAQHLAATGQKVDPAAFGGRLTGTVGDLIRTLGYAHGAGGSTAGGQ